MNDFFATFVAFPFLGWMFSFLLGSIVGSFLNVCIYRIPQGKSIVFPGSRCQCGASIRWYDNLPIVSWILLRGKARCCGASFSIRYPIVELITGLLFLLAWIQFTPLVAVCIWIFIGLLIPSIFIDLDYFIIPDRFSVGGMLVGIFLSVLVPELHAGEQGNPSALYGLREAVIGALIGSSVVYWFGAIAEIIFRKEAMGQGDVKLAGCFGAFCGWQGAVFSLFGGALIGTIFLLPILFWQRMKGKPLPEKAASSVPPKPASASDPMNEEEDVPIGFGSAVPFGPMLCAAILLYLFGLAPYVDFWFADVGEVLRLSLGR